MFERRPRNIVSIKNVLGIESITVSLLIVFFFHSANLATKYILDPQVSFIYINGTSTLHDWTVVTEQMKGSLNAKIDMSGIEKN